MADNTTLERLRATQRIHSDQAHGGQRGVQPDCAQCLVLLGAVQAASAPNPRVAVVPVAKKG